MNKTSKGPKLPIDAKDMPWSELGRDALDAASERAWEVMRSHGLVWNCVEDEEMPPYHVMSSREQTAVQRVVFAVIGQAVPALLRDRTSLYPKGSDTYHALRELADEIEDEHRKRA